MVNGFVCMCVCGCFDQLPQSRAEQDVYDKARKKWKTQHKKKYTFLRHRRRRGWGGERHKNHKNNIFKHKMYAPN